MLVGPDETKIQHLVSCFGEKAVITVRRVFMGAKSRSVVGGSLRREGSKRETYVCWWEQIATYVLFVGGLLWRGGCH